MRDRTGTLPAHSKQKSNRPPQVPEVSERTEGLYVILDYVKVTVFGDPEEEAVQGKGPIKGPFVNSRAK